jgi:hypothetical protein
MTDFLDMSAERRAPRSLADVAVATLRWSVALSSVLFLALAAQRFAPLLIDWVGHG